MYPSTASEAKVGDLFFLLLFFLPFIFAAAAFWKRRRRRETTINAPMNPKNLHKKENRSKNLLYVQRREGILLRKVEF